jgi:poly-gamma-glutamate synthesis protein (capsule biosynthesis protein)
MESQHNRASRKPQGPSFGALASRAGILVLFLLIFCWTVKGSPISTVTSLAKSEEPSAEEPAADALAEDPLTEDTAEAVTATLTYTGDFVAHLHVVDSVYDSASDSYDFVPIFQYAGDWMNDTDFLLGNLETTLAGAPYSGSPDFSSPDDLAESLKEVGYDLLTTANNHCLDQGFAGLSRTLDVLDQVGIDHLGTYRSQEEFDENQGVLVEEINGLSVAFLDYTYGVNYKTVENDFSVNRFNLNTGDETKVTLDTDRMDRDMAYARSLNTDFIIVLMHWGVEYETEENADQDMVADYLIARGADAILGGHSHVPQPMEYRTVTDDNGETHTGFVSFSLGNLVSNQSSEYTNLTAAVKLTLTKDPTSGECSVSDVTYTPLYLLNRGNGSSPQYLLLDTQAAIADYEGARENPYLDDTIYSSLQESLGELRGFFGSQWAYTGDSTDADSSDTAQDLNADGETDDTADTEPTT